MPIYEKIETIVLSFLSNGCTSGTFGSIARGLNGGFQVSTSGHTFDVRTTAIGWAVTNGYFVGEDADLIEAARLATT
jgi:hypothetical protein